MNVMIDLETLGTSPDSVILAIGAVKFNGLTIVDEFYEVIDPQSCIDAGLKVDVSTVMWWMQQGEEARSAFKRPGYPLVNTLAGFTAWLGADDKGHKVWGNGADFDNAMLQMAYKKAGQMQPWKFWDNRCYRTMKALRPDIKMQRVGTHHNALDDAKDQALHLIEILKAVGA